MADQHKHTISGPGAADFIAAQNDDDRPETSPDKSTDGESHFTDARNLELAVPDDDEVPKGERTIYTGTDTKKDAQRP